MTNRDAVALGALLRRIEQFRQFGQFEQTSETRLRHWSVNADWYSAELLRRESIMRIIEEADRLASQAGPEASPADENRQGPNLGRLEFITRPIAVTDEGLRYRESSQSLKYYPIAPLSISNDVFRQREATPSTNENAPLWEQFAAERENLPTGSFAVYFDSLLHLLHKFTWCIPSEPDGVISLYDHARSGAALAVSLYDKQQEDAGDARQFLLIEGDVSGIQQFIYNPAFNGQELQDRIARRLRGRSFYLNLLLKTVADWLIEKLGLYSVNILWASGGHFLIVAPNTERTRDKLKDSGRKIQRWIWSEFRGALGLVIADLPVTGEGLRRFSKARERLAQIAARLKYQQIAAPLSFGEDLPGDEWANPWVLNMGDGICRDTGRDLSQKENEISNEAQREEETQPPRSPQSLLFDAIGRALVNAQTIQLRRRDGWPEKEDIARLPRDEVDAGKLKEAARGALIEFPGLNRTWLLSEEIEPLDSADLCLRLAGYRNHMLDFLSDDPHPRVAQGFVFMATAVKTEEAEGRDVIVDFHELAERAEGVNFLGALRMDVDNLGYIFAHGLPDSEGSIAKIANLSRMFDWFFAAYINTLVEDKNLYTTYAGGDDLFIVGAWDEVLDLADTIQREFKSFCGENPDLHISAGIALRKGKYPIGRAADEAGDRLDQVAKAQKSAWLDGDSDKNALAFLERKISWEKWMEARAVGERIIEAYKQGKISRRFIYNLLELYQQHIDPQRDPAKERSGEDWIWQPRFHFSLARNVKESKDGKDDLRAYLLQEITKHKDYLSILAGYVLLKTRNLDIDTRGEADEEL